MFTTGVFGVFATVDDLARGMALASDPGSLAGSITRYTQQTKRIDDRLAKIAEQQQTLQEQLVKQRSEEHTSELQSLMRTSYAVFCLKKKSESQMSVLSAKDRTLK